MTKIENGVEVECSPDEEKEILATWVANDTKVAEVQQVKIALHNTLLDETTPIEDRFKALLKILGLNG